MYVRTLAVVGLIAFLAGPAPAPPPPPVKQGSAEISIPVPAKAGVVVSINGWGKARGRLNELLKTALPLDAKAIADKFDETLKSELLNGRELKGLDADKRIYVAVENLQALNDDTFPGTIYVPITDSQAFINGFFKETERKAMVKKGNGIIQIPFNEDPYFMLVKDGYAIVSNSEDRIAAYLNPYETLTSKQMGADVGATFLSADVAVYVNTEVINETFGDEIKQFRGLIEILGKGGLGGGGFGPGMDKDQLDAFITFFKGMFQCVEDSRAFVISLEFRPTGLAFRIQSRFEKDSVIGKVLATEKPNSMKSIGLLPPNFSSYSAQATGPRTTAAIRGLSKEYSVSEEHDAARKAINEYQEIMKADESLMILSGNTMPERSMTIIQTKDAKAYVGSYLKMVQSLPEAAKNNNVIIKGKPTVTQATKTYEGFTFHKISTVLDFEATVKDQPEGTKEITLASMKKFAKEKSTSWLGTDGKTVLTIVADDWAQVEASMKAYTAKDKTEWPVDARKELPETVSYLMYLDTVYAINALGDSIGEMGGAIPNLPLELPKLEKVKGDPVYLGFSVTLKPEVGQLDIFIPAKSAGYIRKALSPLFQ